MKKRSSKKQIPDIFQNLSEWEANRRTFLRSALIAGAMTQISFFQSCSTKLKEGNDILSAEQATILNDVIALLFPDDGNGPGPDDINVFGYIMWVLHDSLNRKSDDNEFVIEGLARVNETAGEMYVSPFVELDAEQKQTLMGEFIVSDDGKKWSSVMITLILEALLLDPLYGGNVDESGWKWLKHTPGFPRPTEELRYERIMEKQMKL